MPHEPNQFRPLVPWASIFNRVVDPAPVTTVTCRAGYLADLEYLGDVCELTLDRKSNAIFASFADAPEIRAAIMPMLGRSDEERQRETAAYEARQRERRLEAMPTSGPVL